ncbi:hypothetical protein A8E96_25305 [Burkholderia cenocepacia]|nr:hypothetical protein A8E96_25305 [Burkholderia cenocepacia]
MDLYDTLAISHKIGYPTVQLHIRLQNIGAREVKVSRIAVTLKRDGQVLQTMSARNTVQPTGPALLFAPFKLQGREEWVQIANFFMPFTREDDRVYRTAEHALRTNIHAKIHALNEPHRRAVEADADLVVPFTAMFDAHFNWLPGQYDVDISTETEPAAAALKQSYRFILFESDTQALRDLAQDYKLGAGVYFNNTNRQEWVNPQLLKV